MKAGGGGGEGEGELGSHCDTKQMEENITVRKNTKKVAVVQQKGGMIH